MHTESVRAAEGWPQAHCAEKRLQHLGDGGGDLRLLQKLQWGADGVGFGTEWEEQGLRDHGNVVHSCIWEEAEEDLLTAGEDGGGTGFMVLLFTACWGDGCSTTATPQQGGVICIYDFGRSWPRGTWGSWCWLQLIPDCWRGRS